MSSDSSEGERQRLWKAFLEGFRESAEGWNGEVAYTDHPKKVERRLKARFEALHESGNFEVNDDE